MKLHFSTEQKIIIGLNITTISACLYFYFERRLKMKNEEILIPTFLQKRGDILCKNNKEQNKEITTKEIKKEEPKQDLETQITEPILAEPVNKLSVNTTANKLVISAVEKEKLSDTVKNMDESQMEVLLENVPTELIFAQIGKELAKQKAFKNAICDAMSILQ